MNAPLTIEVSNTVGARVRKLETCTFPLGVLTSRVYFLIADDGSTFVGVPTEQYPTHRNMEIIGEWPVGDYNMIAVPVDGVVPDASQFRLHPSVTSVVGSEPIAPTASFGDRPLTFTLRDQRRAATGLWMIWDGTTTDHGPQVVATVHKKIGDLSPLADIVASVKYSDRRSADWTIEGPFRMSFGEPVSWERQPYAESLNSETRLVLRGTMLFTVGDNGDTALGATRFYPGAISVRAHRDVWEGKFLLHSNFWGNPRMAVRGPVAQIAFTSGTGGRRAFGVQDYSALMGPVSGLRQLLLDTDIMSDRPMHYSNLDGTPFDGTRAENQQYNGAFYNSQLDHRVQHHDNFGKPRTWAPRMNASPQDYGHMSIHPDAEAWVLTSDPIKLEDLIDQAEALLMARGPRYGSRNDRYVGQPLCALAILAKCLPDPWHTRIVQKIRQQMVEVAAFRDTFASTLNNEIWPGDTSALYGVHVPQPWTDPNGAPMGWAPWQVARYVQGIMDVYALDRSLVPLSVLADAVRFSEAVMLDGWKRTVDAAGNVHFQSYYAVAYAPGGERLNVKEDLRERGLAGSLQAVDDGYLWTYSPATWFVLEFSDNGDAVKRAQDCLSIMQRQVRDLEEASWMPQFERPRAAA